jgi:LacI family gluconate utilization system Gnt-I transcriptional repressor
MLPVTLNDEDTPIHARKPGPDDIVTAPPSRRARRGHGRPTLHDVAQVAAVTRITVSRYLREPDRVAPETTARIRDAIAQTGYVPNRQAGELASAASRMVAALIPNVGHSIFAQTIQGLQEGLRNSGHELLLASTDYSMEREEAQLRALIGWNPGALIVTGRHHTPGALRLLEDAQAAGAPVIEIWDRARDGEAAQFCQIGFNHEAVGHAMARHLIDHGHRWLAYVDSSVAEDYRAHERGEGFLAEARAAGAHVTMLRAAAGDVFDAGRQVFASLRRAESGRITAAAFANDHLACGALMEAKECGVDVPSELAVLGFGDFPLGRQLRPSLSTVRPPRAEIGRAAAAALLRAIVAGDDAIGEALPWELIARQSTR